MPNGCSKCGTENADAARFCRACGTALTAAPAASGGNRPGRAAVVLGAFAVALVAAVTLWFAGTRAPAAPSFDSAPPPSVLGASPPPASASPSNTDALAAPRSMRPATPAPAASSELWDPIDPPSPTTSSTTSPPPQTAPAHPPPPAHGRASHSTPERVATRKPPRAPNRAPPRTLTQTLIQAPAQAPTQAPTQTLTPAATSHRPAAPRTVQDRCTASNALMRGICESRECMGAEHAGESVCQRIRAADDRRREQ